jgi:hypothetical protein
VRVGASPAGRRWPRDGAERRGRAGPEAGREVGVGLARAQVGQHGQGVLQPPDVDHATTDAELRRCPAGRDATRADRFGQGFFAALDQSGGSTPKALAEYGVAEDRYGSEAEMFDLVHAMRTRVISDPAFDGARVLAAILFEQTMEREIGGVPTGQFLWERKRVVPILKVDKGLADEQRPARSLGSPCLRQAIRRAPGSPVTTGAGGDTLSDNRPVCLCRVTERHRGSVVVVRRGLRGRTAIVLNLSWEIKMGARRRDPRRARQVALFGATTTVCSLIASGVLLTFGGLADIKSVAGAISTPGFVTICVTVAVVVALGVAVVRARPAYIRGRRLRRPQVMLLTVLLVLSVAGLTFSGVVIYNYLRPPPSLEDFLGALPPNPNELEIRELARNYAEVDPPGSGPWPFVVIADPRLGMKVRTSGLPDGVQVGSAAANTSVWVTCKKDTGFNPQPGDPNGSVWYQVKWPNEQPTTTFFGSSPVDAYHKWVYGGLIVPIGQNGRVPTCE